MKRVTVSTQASLIHFIWLAVSLFRLLLHTDIILGLSKASILQEISMGIRIGGSPQRNLSLGSGRGYPVFPEDFIMNMCQKRNMYRHRHTKLTDNSRLWCQLSCQFKPHKQFNHESVSLIRKELPGHHLHFHCETKT